MNRALLLALLLAAPGAGAATACRASAGGGLAFGDYDPLARAPADSQATVTVSCERDGGPAAVSLTMALDAGTHGASVGARRLRHASGSADFLAYGLFRDPARASTWGTTAPVDTVGATLAVPERGSASARFTVYGRIPARQDVSRAGRYADAVRVMILY